MVVSAKRAQWDALRELDFSGISASYAAIGTPVAYNARMVTISNLTQGIMIFSDDNTVSAGKFVLAAGATTVRDITSNINPNQDDNFVLPKNIQFYVKQRTAPTSGSVFIEVIHD